MSSMESEMRLAITYILAPEGSDALSRARASGLSKSRAKILGRIKVVLWLVVSVGIPLGIARLV